MTRDRNRPRWTPKPEERVEDWFAGRDDSDLRRAYSHMTPDDAARAEIAFARSEGVALAEEETLDWLIGFFSETTRRGGTK